METTLSGRTMDFRFTQSVKAQEPIAVRLSGRVMPVQFPLTTPRTRVRFSSSNPAALYTRYTSGWLSRPREVTGWPSSSAGMTSSPSVSAVMMAALPSSSRI